MRYIVMQFIKDGDVFSKGFNDRDTAINYAIQAEAYLSDSERKRLSSLYVLESINPDEDAIDHFDGDIIKELI